MRCRLRGLPWLMRRFHALLTPRRRQLERCRLDCLRSGLVAGSAIAVLRATLVLGYIERREPPRVADVRNLLVADALVIAAAGILRLAVRLALRGTAAAATAATTATTTAPATAPWLATTLLAARIGRCTGRPLIGCIRHRLARRFRAWRLWARLGPRLGLRAALLALAVARPVVAWSIVAWSIVAWSVLAWSVLARPILARPVVARTIVARSVIAVVAAAVTPGAVASAVSRRIARSVATTVTATVAAGVPVVTRPILAPAIAAPLGMTGVAIAVGLTVAALVAPRAAARALFARVARLARGGRRGRAGSSEPAPDAAEQTLAVRRYRGDRHRRHRSGLGGRGPDVRDRRRRRRRHDGLHGCRLSRLFRLRARDRDLLRRLLGHLVAGDLVLDECRFVVADAPERIVRRLHVRIRNQHHFAVVAFLNGAQPVTLLIDQERRHLDRQLRDHLRGTILARFLADQPQDRERQRFDAADRAEADATRAGDVGRLAERRPQPLP